jgi:Zn-finger nucleic acid-binding protein
MASTTCPSCEKPVAREARICPHCGTSSRRVRQREEHVPVTCPGCRGPSDIVLLGESRLDLCQVCKGLWFDKGELQEFGEALQDGELRAQVQAILVELRRKNVPAPSRAYCLCPVCRREMLRQNYATVSGIVVQTCSDHGTWAEHRAALSLVELFGERGPTRLAEIAGARKKAQLESEIRNLKIRENVLKAELSAMTLRERILLMVGWFF